MFVSLYSTYVNTSGSNKSADLKSNDTKEEKYPFSETPLDKTVIKSHTDKNLPIDYISNYKSFNNKQKLQEEFCGADEQKLKQLSVINNAKTAYEANTTMFSLVKKPSAPLGQTQKIDEKLPREIKEIKEKNLRQAMVSTYAANNRYYEITAA